MYPGLYSIPASRHLGPMVVASLVQPCFPKGRCDTLSSWNRPSCACPTLPAGLTDMWAWPKEYCLLPSQELSRCQEKQAVAQGWRGLRKRRAHRCQLYPPTVAHSQQVSLGLVHLDLREGGSPNLRCHTGSRALVCQMKLPCLCCVWRFSFPGNKSLEQMEARSASPLSNPPERLASPA